MGIALAVPLASGPAMSNDPHTKNIYLTYKGIFNWQILSAGLVFILAGLWLIVVAEQGPPYQLRGRPWSGDPQTGRMIIWALGLASFCLGAPLLVGFAITKWRPWTIIISPSAITAPIRLLSFKKVTVPFATISSLSRFRRLGVDHLAIHHAGGLIEIFGDGLPKELPLDEFERVLNERRGEVR